MDWYEVVQTMIEYMGLIPEGKHDDPELALESMKRRWDEIWDAYFVEAGKTYEAYRDLELLQGDGESSEDDN